MEEKKLLENNSSLIQINKKASVSQSRRNFIKGSLIGATALTATACADRAKQKILPNVHFQPEQIPGVAVWYRSTCLECSAGCGIEVKTREGRAIKIEGSKKNPINKGGLCGLGQASLQGLYDPDRIRQPLKKIIGVSGKPEFQPISWEQALQEATDALKGSSNTAVISQELTGSMKDIVDNFAKAFKGSRYVYEPLAPVALALASKELFGVYGIPNYQLENADLILNFGADFLETWISPVELARKWAQGRRKKHPIKVIHIEPRLSLTGANADLWLANAPASELAILSYLINELISKESIQNKIADRDIKKIKGIIQKITSKEASQISGIERDKILLIADMLLEAKRPLVLTGGINLLSENGDKVAVAGLILNYILGSIGVASDNALLDYSRVRTPETSLKKITKLVDTMYQGKVEAVVFIDANLNYTLPSDLGFKYALNKVPYKVAISSYLDETTKLCDIILPKNHFIESWQDVEAVEGYRSIVQPAMTPVFNTKDQGDILIAIAKKGGADISAGKDNFYLYLQEKWKDLHKKEKIGQPFKKWWRIVVEEGGYFSKGKLRKITLKLNNFTLKDGVDYHINGPDGAKGGLVFYPYASVKSFDGRAANKPWLQELPDPVSQIVWDSWAEIHPNTAKRYGLTKDSVVYLRNKYGELKLPVYITSHIQEGVVAVPLGQGHSDYGRFARALQSNGNPYNLLAKKEQKQDWLALLSIKVNVIKGIERSDVVNVQGSDSQLNRGLAQTEYINGHSNHHNEHHSNGHHTAEHGGEHKIKQMYEQRRHPLYNWGMVVDLASCTGCSACVVACYAENNIPVVGKEVCSQGREMSWLRIERYDDSTVEELKVSFLPMMCQHCNNAPCEPVCPVYGTYHNEEGLNVMVYNRCVGTRYCSNNCTYKVRRFNWFDIEFPEPMQLQLNPDVTKRTAGVMEKCTFCIQRITEAKDKAKDAGRLVKDGEIEPACVQSCPTQALTFGNLKDKHSKVSKLAKDKRAYKILDHHINTQPSVIYLKDMKYKI